MSRPDVLAQNENVNNPQAYLFSDHNTITLTLVPKTKAFNGRVLASMFGNTISRAKNLACLLRTSCFMFLRHIFTEIYCARNAYLFYPLQFYYIRTTRVETEWMLTDFNRFKIGSAVSRHSHSCVSFCLFPAKQMSALVITVFSARRDYSNFELSHATAVKHGWLDIRRYRVSGKS